MYRINFISASCNGYSKKFEVIATEYLGYHMATTTFEHDRSIVGHINLKKKQYQIQENENG